jgi:hypothetical protein
MRCVRREGTEQAMAVAPASPVRSGLLFLPERLDGSGVGMGRSGCICGPGLSDLSTYPQMVRVQ